MARPGIRISAQRDGFRRAGVRHPKKPTDYPVDRFSEDQLRQFLAEPMLSVSPVELEDDEDDKAAADKAAADKAAADRAAADKAAADKAAADKAAADNANAEKANAEKADAEKPKKGSGKSA
ncbi:HI1506-related protein [Thalassobaculum sp. OXR-137]|uniref:HI1506-related protein n=1 Tax=Thalassobaculum sp. OXR-137 TaxID=3100173 RepID=UPI002AC9BD5D|nr:HI1506-related protein [Thalassobaculum sp. OXR-137]WPZ33221.1 HI1506-related protein [Thalassobaculum sp. OXR-137]WPZ34886.1 HI1506-related protein [Thalassobaculum sp. OXR-137]